MGAVQSGLMLMEAVKSGNFSRYVIIEVNKNLVNSIRNSDNSISINTATDSGIVRSKLTDIEVYNPHDPADLPLIQAAIMETDEMATAIPSVDFYDSGGNSSIVSLLANNINPGKPQILYTSENNNYAAEILIEKIHHLTTPNRLIHFQAVNTVIGKMGGVIKDPKTISELNLDLITSSWNSAFLVEQFNSIIISRITLPGYIRGIQVFQEKDDLLPFEEAKLYGHNAVHSMLGYFAYLQSFKFMSEIRNDKFLYCLGKLAFENESGAFLLKKYQNLEEPLFTREGFEHYASDLLKRMTNPFLRDEVSRICRDPLRKLQYRDRFLGTIREAFKQNIEARLIAWAVLAAIIYLIREKITIGFPLPRDIADLNHKTIPDILKYLWRDETTDGYLQDSIDLICSQVTAFTNTILKQGNK